MSYYLVNNDPKQIKRDIRGVTLCVAAFIMTMSVVSMLVVIVIAFAEHADILFDVVQSTNGNLNAAAYSEVEDIVMDIFLEYSGLASIIGMICGLPWFFMIRGKNFLTTDVKRVHSKVSISTILILFVLVMGVQFFMTLIQLSMEPFFNESGGSLTDVLDDSVTGLATSFWGVLYIVFIGPICEELVFRGAVMRKLERYGANFAIIVSSLLFGLYHIILFQAVFAFLIGLVLAYTAGRFSLKWAVLLHMLNNGMAALSIGLGSEYFDIALNVCYMLALVATIVILIVGRKHLYAQQQAGAPSQPRVYSRAFSSPWLIIYIILCVLGGLQLVGLF